MQKVLVFTVFLQIFSTTASGETNETESTSDGIGYELTQILLGNGLLEQKRCDEVKRSDINFYLFARNLTEAVELETTNTSLISVDKKLIILIHGWLASVSDYGMQGLKDAYLSRYDSNVLVVDWNKISHQLYTTAVCKLPKISNHVVNLLLELKREKGFLPINIHIIGHSLGAQMSGLVGQKYFLETGEKIDRITGLDPAGPLFLDESTNKRIDASDAVFVDIIHTNGGMFGYYSSCGTVDVYINCGSTQPNCYVPDFKNDQVHNVKDFASLAVACSHLRSFDYLIRSITSKFEATPCDWCPLGCPPILSFFKTKFVMGEDCDRNATGGYFVFM